MMDQKKKKIIIISAIAVVIVVVAAVIISKLFKAPAMLHVMVAPASATIEIDGKTYTNGDFEIKEGKYTATISKEGFATQKVEFTTRPQSEGKTYLETYLIQNDGGEDWYASHPDDDEIRWYVDESRTQNKTNAFYNNNPILSQLPILVEFYSNNYTSHTKYEIVAEINSSYTAFTIEINDYTGGNRDNALDKIREAGFNPDDYQVNYHDYSQDFGWGQAF